MAVEALQPLAPSQMRGDAAPSDGISYMQGGAKAVVADSEATRADEPLGAPMSEGGMRTARVYPWCV